MSWVVEETAIANPTALRATEALLRKIAEAIPTTLADFPKAKIDKGVPDVGPEKPAMQAGEEDGDNSGDEREDGEHLPDTSIANREDDQGQQRDGGCTDHPEKAGPWIGIGGGTADDQVDLIRRHAEVRTNIAHPAAVAYKHRPTVDRDL